MTERDPSREVARDSPGDSSDASTPTSEQTTRASHPQASEQEPIGAYRILEQVGTGGMGEVYRAEQLEPIRRTVALKIIKRGMDTKEVITRFEAERQALALMDHPSIAKVFDAGSTPRGRPYFAMEYVKGIPITKYCDEHKLSLHARLELFIQLCDGVQHAHQKAIIHRDLKPSNVLVSIQDEKPVPKIIDFGVAKATAQKLTEKTMYTALGEMIGTPEYMSPEQAALTGEDIDTRTDVYALGVILYELLAGALPFEPTALRKAGFAGIIRMIREQDPLRPSAKVDTLGERGASAAQARRTPPAKLSSRLRGDLDWITMRALEKDRTRRYGSPSELAADVRRHLRHEPVLAGPPSAAYRTRKFVRRHTLGVGLASAAALVLVAFAVTMTVQAKRIARERDRADQEAETSDRVSEFLVSVFNVSDPGEARGNTITAREVLDNGALRIQRELEDQPLLRAKMMDSMGRVYQNLGLHAVADSLLMGALEIRQTELGREHLDTLESLSHLGWLRMWQGRLDEGKSINEEVLAARQRTLGNDHVDTAWSLYALGSLLVTADAWCEGRQLLERALPVFERELGSNHLWVAWCLNDIGLSFERKVDYAAALPFYERALEIKQMTLAPEHYDVATGHGNVGSALLRLDRYKEAKPHLEQSHRILVKSLGPRHQVVGQQSLHNLGELLRLEGNYVAALDTLRSALRIVSDLPSHHWGNKGLFRSLALLFSALGNHAEADSLFQRTLEILEMSGGDAPQLGSVLEEYATFLRQTGRTREANEAAERARAIRAKHEQHECAAE